jgi:hypothetical protein
MTVTHAVMPQNSSLISFGLEYLPESFGNWLV